MSEKKTLHRFIARITPCCQRSLALVCAICCHHRFALSYTVCCLRCKTRLFADYCAYHIAISLVICCLSILSCGNRNPNLSKEQLLSIANNAIQTVPETPAYVFPDTSYVPPAGAKYTEIRSIDRASPPVTLKVNIPKGEKQTLKLSRFGSSIEYTLLRLPDEDDFFLSNTNIRMGGFTNYVNTQIYRLGDHFVSSDALGIRLFDPSGKFVQNLLLSEFEGKRNDRKIEIDFEEYKRASLLDISGTRCFLTFIDYEGVWRNYFDIIRKGRGNEKIWAGEFNLANRPVYNPSSELSSLMPGVEMVPVRNAPAGLFLNDTTLFSFQRVRDPIALTFNNMGDTLCKFKNYADDNGGAYSSDNSFFYRADGALFFRQEFCDTIFRVQSVNRIVPAFCFDFGAQRLKASESASNKTQGKIVPWKWFVFKKMMILIFSEARDCPVCRTRGEVTFHCLLFDKQTGAPTAIDMKSLYPENILIENDLDDGFPIPLNSLRTQGDEIIATFTKHQIEEILKNNVEKINAETVLKLKTAANKLNNNEMLVMVIR